MHGRRVCPARLRLRRFAAAAFPLGGDDLVQLRDNYQDRLFNQYLPFWDKGGIDRRRGGFLCELNDNGSVTDNTKFIWYQGRGIWVYSFLYNEFGKDARWLEIARQGRDFMVKHMYAGGGKWRENVRGDGTPLEGPGENVYGRLFAALGLAEYYRAAGRNEDFQLAEESIRAAMTAYDNPNYTDTHTALYTGLDIDPRGLRSQGHSMVAVVALSGLLAARADAELEDLRRRHVELIVEKFWNPQYRIVNEYLRHDYSRAPGAAAHMFVGHAVETLWIVMAEAVRRRDGKLFDAAAGRVRRLLEMCWDYIFDGLGDGNFFVFGANGRPRGPEYNVKTMFAHCEAMIACMIVLEHTGAAWAAEWYERLRAYALRVMPVPGVGVWRQAVDRMGKDVKRVGISALRKDNFHQAALADVESVEPEANAQPAPFAQWECIVKRRGAIVVVLLCGSALVASSGRAAAGQPAESKEIRKRFLLYCDLACEEFNKEKYAPFEDIYRTKEDPKTHHYPSFEDAHGIRALCAAYDMTGEKKYLDACQTWADRMIAYQERMVPKGAYYMNYCRPPGAKTGDWCAADSGSVGLGVLATAVRTGDAKKKERCLNSVRSFLRLVIDNYVGKQGGITDGEWGMFAGEYYCSTATCGSLMFLAYAETKDPQYMRVALGALDWLNRRDFGKPEPPATDPLNACEAFYCGEFYAVAMKNLIPTDRLRKAAAKQIGLLIQWVKDHQASPDGNSKVDYFSADPYMGGMPYLQYVYARELPEYGDQAASGDQELRHVAGLLVKDKRVAKDGRPVPGRLAAWELMTWTMLSHAEKLCPGELFRTSRDSASPRGGSGGN